MSAKTFIVTPIGKPRMTQRDRWKKRPCVLAYHAYRDAIREQAKGWTPGAVVRVTFWIPTPKSWSKKKKLHHVGDFHQQKPDIDNLVKAFLDCFGEDQHVAVIEASKMWTSDEGFIQAETQYL